MSNKKMKNLLKKIYNIFVKNKLVFAIIGIITLIIISCAVVLLTKNKYNNIIEEKNCVVQFETNGGTTIDGKTIKCGTNISKPADPEKEGFVFKFWQYNGVEFDFNSSVEVDLLLEAYYEADEDTKIVVVSFDTSGGSKISDIEVKKGKKISKPVNPNMSGYKFVGWYKDYKEFDFNTPIDENITLKAKWEEKNSKTDEKNNNVKTSSDKYKCSGSYRSDVPVKNVVNGYKDHVNWTWTTNLSYGGTTDNVCYITYKTSDSSVASVDSNGIITANKAGTAYISECVNDTETKKELFCFKGQLNVQDVDDTTTVTSKYDEIANKYVGTWYLEGYSDVYIKVSKYKMYYEAMDISPVQIDIFNNGGIYPKNGYGNIQISYENWDNDIKKYNVTLGKDYISIKTPVATYKFIKKAGSKNKYSSSKFYEALGTWYLYNKPEANFEIYKDGDDKDPTQYVSYCITPNSFNFETLEYENSFGGSLGCGPATDNEILERYGISINNGEMTIIRNGKSVKLYKTKKTVSVSNILLSDNQLNMIIGESKTITYTINPTDAYNKNVVWSSSNSAVATIDNGKIVAKSEGSTIITVTTSDGNKTANCTVNVSKINVNGISLNTNSLTLIKGNTSTLISTISPNNATNKDVSWSSSNPSVATVNSSGMVTAVSKGTATITVTSSDGNKSASCVVEVKNPALSGSLSAGLTLACSDSGCGNYVFAELTASGGEAPYTYYIEAYKDGVSKESVSSNKAYLPRATGSYVFNWTITDSSGEKVSGTKTFTYSN